MKELWPGWETVEAIGTGGFAQVYKIKKKDTGDGRDYYSALKLISIPQSPSEYAAYLGEGYDDATITAIFTNQVKRIEDEFHMMSQFKGNSNIVSYEDHMIVPHEDGKGWDILIRMELLTSLTSYCGNHAMTEEDTVNLGIGICHALELCGKKNIIHRDIKPQNIFVNEFGDYKLGDFGIAKSMDHTTHATKTGTYTYMAPEVYRGESYGANVDIYSLGLVLYWLLNERRMPFLPLPPAAPTATQIEESRSKRLAGEALPPPKNGSDELKAIVLKACAFDSAKRYANPTAMRQDLERAKALLMGGILFDATEATVSIYADHTVSITGEPAADHTVGIFNVGAETAKAEALSAASDGGSGDETVRMTPPTEENDGGSGKGKLYAIIATIAVMIIIIIILLLRSCGGSGDGVDTTTTWSGDDEPVITTEDEAPITTEPITEPITEEIPPITHEHSISSEGWQSDASSHWYVCACGEMAEKADHTYGEWEVTKEATEAENGEKMRTCSVCSFAEMDTIPMKVHEHSYATEWSDNETSHWHACTCGEKADIAAHSFGEWKITKAATETTTGTRERRCVICNHLEKGTIPVLSHVHSFAGSFVKNETSHWHECACGEKADVSAHTFSGWTVTTPATCTTAGSQTHACVVCSYTENQTINPTGHTEAVDAAVDPTCIKSGLTAGKHCSVCDTVLVKQNSIAATGIHTYENGLCTGCNKGEVSTVTVGDQTITVTYGQPYGPLPEPKKTGYTFDGWYLNGVQIVASTTVNTVGDHALEPKWKANTYNITYVLNNGKKQSGGAYPASYTVEDTLSISGLNYSSYSEYISFIGWYEDEALTKAFDPAKNDLKTNPRHLTLYADFEDFTVYTSIDSTPFNLHGLVILDWRGETNTDLLSHTNRVVEESRYHNIDIEGDVPEVVFIGNANQTFTNFSMYLCGHGSGKKLTIRFVNFNFKASQATPIDLYESNGVDLTIDVVGKSSIGTTIASGNVIDLETASLTITGSGSLALTAGNGASATAAGWNGNAGGNAVIVENLTVNMSGSLTVTGGNGGNGSAGATVTGVGTTGQSGGNGGDGGSAIVAKNKVTVQSGNVVAIGGNGGNGANGSDGADGATNDNRSFSHKVYNKAGTEIQYITYYNQAYAGGNGGNGGYGGNSGRPIECARFDPNGTGMIRLTFGNGGDGGRGATGGDGGTGHDYYGYKSDVSYIHGYNPGRGGNAGNGGNGGDAGRSVSVEYAFDYANVQIIIGENGTAGTGGNAGIAGKGGKGGSTVHKVLGITVNEHYAGDAGPGASAYKGNDGKVR